jgi:hypothetical protein
MEEYDVDSILDMYESDYVREPGSIPIGPRGMVGEITDEQTRFGRPIYKTPEGERVSEKSKTLFLDGNYINVPSIHGGKSFNEDELRLMIKQGNLQPTSVHKSKDEAEAAAKARSASMADGGRTGFKRGKQATVLRPEILIGIAEDNPDFTATDILNKLQKDKTKNYVTTTGS